MTDLQPNISELSHYSEWNNSQRISLVNYMALHLTLDVAIGVAKLFCPDFIEYRGGIFLKLGLDTSLTILDQWYDQLNGDIVSIEKVANHIHLAQDVLPVTFETATYDNVAYFASVLAHCWRTALVVKFPTKSFIVSAEKDGDFDDVIITFWQTNRIE